MTSKTSTEPMTSKDTAYKYPNTGMRSIMQNKIERQRKHVRWSHAKWFWWFFSSLQIQVCFRGITRKLKGITFPTVSLSWVLIFPVLSTLGNQVIRLSVRVKATYAPENWAFQVYPKAPERKWAFPSVGNTVCLCFLYIPAAIESQSGTIPRVVSWISIQSTKKRIQSKWMIGLVSPLWYGDWTAESRVNTHRRYWGRRSMRSYSSSQQAVGWSTYFFPPESDCFCWRPVDKKSKMRGREEKGSQHGLSCDTWIKWLFSQDGKVKANPSSPK